MPAVLQHLVEHLGGLELCAQLERNGAHNGLEHRRQPLVRDDAVVLLAGVTRFRSVLVEVVQQFGGAGSSRRRAPSAQQAPLVVPRIDDQQYATNEYSAEEGSTYCSVFKR